MSEAPAVVLGAGGRLGQECVKRLLTLGRPVRAVVRTPSKYASVLPEDPKLQVVAGDISDPASLRSALEGAKGIIFAASGTSYWSASAVDNEGVGHVAAVAKELSAGPVVLVTSMLVTPKNRWNLIRLILNNIRYSLMDHKYQGEEKLRASGVPYTIVRPGGLANKPAGLTFVTGQGDNVTGAQSISRADVAAVCVEALTNPAANGITFELVSKLPEAPDYEKQLKDMWSGLRTGVHT